MTHRICVRLLIACMVTMASLCSATAAQAYAAGGNTSNYAPAIISCDSGDGYGDAIEYLAFTGTDGQVNLLWYNSPDPDGYNSGGTDSTSDQFYLGQYGIYANGSPSLACVNEPSGDLYLAWSTNSGSIEYAVLSLDTSGNLLTPTIKVLSNEATDASPAISADAGSYLAIAWAGTDPSHHINVDRISLSTGAITKATTSDYTFAGAGVGLAWNGAPAGKGDAFYVGFLDAVGTPYIFLGIYNAETASNALNSARTSQYSPYAPSLSEVVTKPYQGGYAPANKGEAEVFWKGYTNNLLYVGYWVPSVKSDMFTDGAEYPDTTLATPVVDGCSTAYRGTDNRIYYDTQDFFHNSITGC